MCKRKAKSPTLPPRVGVRNLLPSRDCILFPLPFPSCYYLIILTTVGHARRREVRPTTLLPLRNMLITTHDQEIRRECLDTLSHRVRSRMLTRPYLSRSASNRWFRVRPTSPYFCTSPDPHSLILYNSARFPNQNQTKHWSVPFSSPLPRST